MSKYVKVQQGNYRVSVPMGRSITLDVGTSTPVDYRGTVYITGNLVVEGTQTTVDSQTMTVVDPVIVLNQGETGNGVTANGGKSGIEISRGNAVNGNGLFVLDDTKNHLNSDGVSTKGIWSFRDANSNIMGIESASVASPGKMYLTVGSNTGLITVRPGSGIPYQERVFDYSNFNANAGPIQIGADANAIPNAQSVLDVISSAFAYQSAKNITDYDTSVSVADLSSTSVPSIINFKVDGNLKAYIDGSGTTFDNIKIFANTIASLNSTNIILSPITKTIEASGWMLFNNQTSTPSSIASGTYLYSNATIGAGKTGLYIVNTTVSDELVSKRRAILFSMIF